jgi:hypothetical protein
MLPIVVVHLWYPGISVKVWNYLPILLLYGFVTGADSLYFYSYYCTNNLLCKIPCKVLI